MDMTLLMEQTGRFHFLVLHFPIVFIFILPLVIGMSFLNWGKFFRKTIPYIVHGASFMSVIAVILGLLLSKGMDPDDATLLNNHRNFGIITAAVMVITSIYLLAKKPDLEKKLPLTLIILAIAAFIFVHIAADMGGTLVHGKLIILFE